MAYGEPPYYSAPPPYSPYPVPQNNGLAVAALVTGLLGFLCLIPAFAAIGLGIAGLVQSQTSGVGRGMSIAGICLAAAWIVLFIAAVVVIGVVAPSN